MKSISTLQRYSIYTYRQSRVITVRQSVSPRDILHPITQNIIDLDDHVAYSQLINQVLEPGTIGYHYTIQIQDSLQDTLKANLDLFSLCRLSPNRVILNFKDQQLEMADKLQVFRCFQGILQASFDVEVLFKPTQCLDALVGQPQVPDLLANFSCLSALDTPETQQAFLNTLYNLTDKIKMINPSPAVPIATTIELLKTGEFQGYLIIDPANLSVYDDIHQQLLSNGYSFDSDNLDSSQSQPDDFNPGNTCL